MSESNRRERILAAAARLFQHYGQKKTTMADIARDVGIGVGSVYLDFPSKEALLSELARKRARAVSTAMERARAVEPLPARIAAMLEARVDALLHVAEEGTHACELVSCARTTPGFGADVRAALAVELEVGKRSGELDYRDVEQVLDMIEVAFTLLSPPYLFRLDPARALDLAHNLAALVVNGLVRRNAPTSSRG